MALSLDFLKEFLPNADVSHSKQYFQDANVLSTIGFVNLLATDIYVDTSFIIRSPIFINGVLITTFTKDNLVDDTFVCYSIPLNEKYATQNALSIELHKSKLWFLDTLWAVMKGVPWVSFIVFNLLLFVLPSFVGSFLSILNIVALIVVGIYYVGAVIRFIVKFSKSKKMIIEGQTISYTDINDVWVVDKKNILALIPLKKRHVKHVCIFNGVLYIKQAILENDFLDFVNSINMTPEQIEKNALSRVKNVVNYLISFDFCSALFSDNSDGNKSTS